MHAARNTKAANELLSFDLVLKVVERCNLACPYCYYFFQEYDGNDKTALLTEEAEEALPGFLKRSVADLNLERITLVLHGGEPLMMKKKRVDALCGKLRNSLDNGIEFNIAIQTNGVLIDDEWIDVFSKHKIKTGVSIDGPKSLHDKGRPDHKGRGSYDRAVRGLRLLQAAVKDGRLDSAGAMGVVDCEAGKQQLIHLVEELNVRSPNINFPHGGAATEHAVTWNSNVEAHRKMVRHWLDNLIYPDFSYVRTLSEVLFALQSDFGAEWNDRRCSTRHYVATISSDGALLVDDNLLGVDPKMGESGLTVMEHSLLDLVEGPQWQELNDAIDATPKECKECEWFRSCRSGELFNRYSPGPERYSRKSILCDTIKMIHEEVAEYLVRNGVVSIDELATRLETTPTSSAKSVCEQFRSNDERSNLPSGRNLELHSKLSDTLASPHT